MINGPEHEIYKRRRSRNIGLGLTLGAFVLLIMAVTMVKLSQGSAIRWGDQPGGMEGVEAGQ